MRTNTADESTSSSQMDTSIDGRGLEKTISNHSMATSFQSIGSNSLRDHENNLILEIPAGMERGIDIFPTLSKKITSIISRSNHQTNDIQSLPKLDSSSQTLEAAENGEKYKTTPEEEAQYNRFSPTSKKIFLAILSLSAAQGPLAGTSYLPAVKEIAAYFNTSGDVINATSALYTFINAFSPCIFNPLFDFYGKKPIFIFNCIFLTLSSLGVALSINLPMFFVFRCFTGLFAASFIGIAGATCRDIYPTTERAGALSWCLSGVLSATAFGPVIGGIIINFVSWRNIFWLQTAFSGTMTIFGVLLLKETSYELKFDIWKKETGKKFKFIFVNPLKVMTSLRVPNLALIGWSVVTLMFNMYSLLTPIRYVIDPRFGFTNPIEGSLFYLAPGVGMFLSTFFAGKWADHTLKKWIKKRDGRIKPEDRLKSTYISLGFVMPVSILIYGWCIEKKKGGMAVPIIAMFFNGFAQTFIFASLNTYCVDSFPQLGSAALGSNYFIRYIGGAVGAASALPEITAIGVGCSSTISAVLMITGFITMFICTEYGFEIRTKWLKKHGYTEK